MDIYDEVVSKLKKIYDPEVPVDIYNLGLIYNIDFEMCSKGYYCNITMTFTSPNCPVADFLLSTIESSLKHIEDIYKVEIEVVFDPPWTSEMISDEGRELFEMDNVNMG